MARSTPFLVNETRAVVHTTWRVSTRCNLTCQYKRLNRLRNTTDAACMRRQERSPQTLDGPSIPIFYEPTYPNLYLFEKLRRSVVLMEPKFLTVLVGALIHVPPTDSTQHTDRQIDRQTDRQADRQTCLLYTSPSPRDGLLARMPSSA